MEVPKLNKYTAILLQREFKQYLKKNIVVSINKNLQRSKLKITSYNRSRSSSAAPILTRRTASRSLGNQVYVEPNTPQVTVVSTANSTDLSELEITPLLRLMRNLFLSKVKNFKPDVFSSEGVLSKYTEYDLYFLLRYYEYSVTFLKEECIDLLEKYSWYAPGSDLTNNFDISSIRFLITPRLLSYERGYLLSYFQLCIEKTNFIVQTSLNTCLISLNNKNRVHTVNQYDQVFVPFCKDGLSKEEIVYCLLTLLEQQLKDKIKTSKERPDVITYFYQFN